MHRRSPLSSPLALVGGDARLGRYLAGAGVRCFPSTRDGGNGALRRVVDAVAAGRVGVVLLLTRWLGHAEEGAVIAACDAAGVPWRRVSGSLAAVRRTLAENP